MQWELAEDPVELVRTVMACLSVHSEWLQVSPQNKTKSKAFGLWYLHRFHVPHLDAATGHASAETQMPLRVFSSDFLYIRVAMCSQTRRHVVQLSLESQ